MLKLTFLVLFYYHIKLISFLIDDIQLLASLRNLNLAILVFIFGIIILNCIYSTLQFRQWIFLKLGKSLVVILFVAWKIKLGCAAKMQLLVIWQYWFYFWEVLRCLPAGEVLHHSLVVIESELGWIQTYIVGIEKFFSFQRCLQRLVGRGWSIYIKGFGLDPIFLPKFP